MDNNYNYQRLLIIGFTTHSYDVGSALVSAAKSLNLDVAVANISDYQNSLNVNFGKVFYRLAQRRTLEWFDFQQKILSLIEEFKPELVIVTGIIPLRAEIFDTIHNYHAKIINYLTDNPWNPAFLSNIFLRNLSLYDCVFCTKTLLIPKILDLGVRKTQFLPFAFNPELHWIEHQDILFAENPNYPDICFIGTGDKDRYKLFKALIPKIRGNFQLYGTGWDKNLHLKKYSHGFLYGQSYRKTVQNCKINIGIVRWANCDGHAMRSYEIPACGGVGIYEDTPEHRSLFKSYPDYGFFTSVADLAEKCNWLLEHPEARQAMCNLGYELVVNGGNTYCDRLKSILSSIP